MSRNVIFVAPYPSPVTMRFVRAAASLPDVRLLGVVHTPPDDAGAVYHDLVRVTEPSKLEDIVEGVEVLRRRHGEPHRIIGILETLQVTLAAVRERFGVAGTSVKTAELFRDKAKMKDALRAAGVAVARHKLVTSLADARAFVEEVGLPLVLKPLAGMGSRATFRVRSDDELRAAVEGMSASAAAPILAEEMLRGSEHSLEAITLGGAPRVSSISDYQPSCLEVLETPWVQWAVVLPRELDEPRYERAREVGVATIRALGLVDGMSHMEWFERADGTVAVGEIAQRPPGPQLCHMTGVVHDIDPYRAWARAVVDGELDAPWERKYAAGCAYIRGMGRGRVAAVTGVRETHEAIAGSIVEARLPTIGATKSDTYEGDGYVMVRHESTEKVRAMIKTIIETIKIHYVS